MLSRLIGTVALIACAGFPGWNALAGESSDADAPNLQDNVRIVISVGEQQPGGVPVSRTHELIVRSNSTAKLTTGWRVPIPVTSFNTSTSTDGAITPVTSYSYQNVGLTAQLKARFIEKRIALSGRIELSEVDPPQETGGGVTPQPTIGTFNHEFEVVLSPGIPKKVVTVTKPSGGTLLLEITASRAD